jgi:1-acyl-sn-glycerol-3-phosphate acyltransferase
MSETPDISSGRLRRLSEVNTEPAEKALVRVVWILNAVLKRVSKHEWQGQEKIPRTGGVVFVVNHVSNLDPVAFGQYLAYAGRYPHYLAKASVFRIPIVGRIISACGQIPVERGTHNAVNALSAAIQAVEDGGSITVYPEGTITLDPDLWPMRAKTGAARIALESGAPVIPVGQWGSQLILGSKKILFPRVIPRHTLKLKAGDPVDLDDLRSVPITPAVLREATDRMMTAVTALVADLRGEPAPARPFEPGPKPGVL